MMQIITSVSSGSVPPQKRSTNILSGRASTFTLTNKYFFFSSQVQNVNTFGTSVCLATNKVDLTLGVLTSSTVKFCSRGQAVWGNVKASEEAWGAAAGERSMRTPCGSSPACAELLVDCGDTGNGGGEGRSVGFC